MFTFDIINKNILLGSCPKNLQHLKLLKNAGTTAILNLQSDEDFVFHKIDFLKLEMMANQLDIVIYRIPMIDFDNDSLRQNLPRATKLLNKLIKVKHKVFVHCNAGIERSPTTVVSYLCNYQDLSLDEAYDHVSQKRASRAKKEIIEVIKI